MNKSIIDRFFFSQVNEHLDVASNCKNSLLPSFKRCLKICLSSLRKKRKILFFGNGGSAADAQHLATELVVKFSENRKAIPALSLTTDTSVLTATGNDFGFKSVFSRQIEAIGNTGDVAIGISTSGKSENIIKALEKAKEQKLKCIALTGKYTKDVMPFCDEIISIPATNTSRIQEMHIFFGQILCNAIEYELKLANLVKEDK
tara:strand:+ start:15 stop:623 length:609 start_codon:yes stop_codon:yes gene_type:complete